jgi:hypothetical protein
VELPGIGSRQVAVHSEEKLAVGQEVVIQCVPNPLNPGRYKFQVVTQAPAPEKPSSHRQQSADITPPYSR